MALTEQRVLKQVTILPQSNSIQVQWADQILRDGELVSENFHRSAYGQDQKDAFVSEVDDALPYVAIMGW